MICDTCPRQSYCQYPCQDYSIELGQDSLVGVSYGINDNVINENKSNQEENEENNSSNSHETQISCDNDISGFLNYSVEDDEWLEILKGKLTIEKAIDTDEIFSYMDALNRDYCNEHNLCEKCRSPLVEINDPRGEYFGKPVYEKVLICEHCGE